MRPTEILRDLHDLKKTGLSGEQLTRVNRFIALIEGRALEDGA